MADSITNSFHRNADFQFPAQPLSPPETNVDSAGPSNPRSSMIPRGVGDLDESYISARTTESPASRLKRVSTLAYRTSRNDESRDRTTTRTSKPLIIVIPPTAILHEHGQLGHTLSMGPSQRLSHGILMPLFPTMYGQLTAIAREFNFPSTAGLCIYFHFTDGAITVTPRVSDETWQMIWSHVFDDRSGLAQPTSKPPINGKIEFDIDLHHARWYAAWLASSRREALGYPISAGVSVAPSASGHDRMDSRSTLHEETAMSDIQETGTVRLQQKFRHLPKKLSLIDKVEIQSFRALPRPSPLAVPHESIAEVSDKVLSTIMQEDEPPSAKQDLADRVNSWRATSKTQASTLAKKGQTSLEPANMPNTLSDEALAVVEAEEETEELNLEEFSWSVSSLGPGDDDLRSIASGSRLPSVHVEHRGETSVCMTPSEVSSFGPFDYDINSPVCSSDRLPSPDIAWRLLEDVPPTPSTTTSWGPPSVQPPTPESEQSFFSLDIAERAIFSPPETPMTATSWGPISWPVSPVISFRADSVHIDARGDFSLPVSPSTAASWGAPLSFPPTPATPEFVRTPDVALRSFESAQRRTGPWSHVWPYRGNNFAASAEPVSEGAPAEPWRHAWPYHSSNLATSAQLQVEVPAEPWPHSRPYRSNVDVPVSVSPDLRSPDGKPWEHGWPYSQSSRRLADVPTAAVENADTTDTAKRASDVSGIWPFVWPLLFVYPKFDGDVGTMSTPMRRPPTYPFLEIYETVYPHFSLYPSAAASQMSSPAGNIRLGSSLSYPENLGEIYPVVRAATSSSDKLPISIRQESVYPFLNIYPDVYPHFSLYPSAAASVVSDLSPSRTLTIMAGPLLPYPSNLSQIYPVTQQSNGMSVRLRAEYPTLEIYAPIYPHFDLYPQPAASKIAPITLKKVMDVSVTLGPSEAYPNNLRCIYPAVAISRGISVRNPACYPTYQLYAPVYPYFDLYPAVAASGIVKKPSTGVSMMLRSSLPYPYNLDSIYPTADRDNRHGIPHRPQISYRNAGYPAFDIYPEVAVIEKAANPTRILVHLNAVYPVFNLYPAIYPAFDIYPSLPSDVHGHKTEQRLGIHIAVDAIYPTFNLYPPVYPNMEIYPPTKAVNAWRRLPEISLTLPSRYPSFVLYPPVYPHFGLYPSISEPQIQSRQSRRESLQVPLLQTPKFTLPSVRIFPPTPATPCYPSVPSFPPQTRRLRKYKLTHSELHAIVMMEISFDHQRDGEVDDPVGELPSLRHASPSRKVSPTSSPRVQDASPVSNVSAARQRRRGSSAAFMERYSSIPPIAHPPPGSPERGAPLRRSISSAPARPVSMMDSMPDRPRLRRSVSVGLPSHPAALLRNRVAEAKGTNAAGSTAPSVPWSPPSPDSPPVASPPARVSHKRDSVVLQRVRAFSSLTEAKETHSALEALSDFPMSEFPMPPVPQVTKAVNHN